MAARDGKRIDGTYHFDCEACGSATTARRSHARACSPPCAATLRTRPARRETESLRFYVSHGKLEATLQTLRSEPGREAELVVGVDAGNREAAVGRLRVESKGAEGGLVFELDAPYSPFDE